MYVGCFWIKENYENSRKFEDVIKESTIEGLVGMYLLCTRDNSTHFILDVYICTKCCQCLHGVLVTIESSQH